MIARLATQDAVWFAQALVVRVAAASTADVLAVKGDSAAHHGLRPPRVSGDADVWIRPAHLDRVLDALERCGWKPRDRSDLNSAIVTHSATHIHPDWPCDIDVHSAFPGFLGASDEVFELLWRRRQEIEQANVEVSIPDRSGAVLISALHSIRTPAQTLRHRAELEILIDVCATLSVEAREDIVALAAATGAVDTARPFLETLGVTLAPPAPHGVNPGLDEWRARVAADGVIGAQAWIATRRLAWRRRPAAAWSIVWPGELDFRLDHPEIPPGRGPLLRARFARLGRGIRQIPAVIQGRRQARRGITETSLLEGDK